MKNKKKVVSLIVVVMMLISIVPSFAQETKVAQVDTWAIAELNEGERLGTYPIEWYYDNFQSDISLERLNVILQKVDYKLKKLGYKENEGFKPLITESITRKDVVTRLYNLLAKYNIPEELELGNDAIEYMKNRGILKGTYKGLELDRNCTTQEAVVLSIRFVLDTYDVLNQGSKGFVWKVSKGQNTVYLLGSIHLGTIDMYPINNKVLKAFNEADALVVEADLTKQDELAKFQAFGMYSDGTTLKDHVKKETWNPRRGRVPPSHLSSGCCVVVCTRAIWLVERRWLKAVVSTESRSRVR